MSNNLLDSLDDLPAAKSSSSNKSTKKNKFIYEEGVKKVTAFSLSPGLIDKINRKSYWSRYSKSEIVEAILSEYFKNKDYEPVPDGSEKIRDILD